MFQGCMLKYLRVLLEQFLIPLFGCFGDHAKHAVFKSAEALYQYRPAEFPKGRYGMKEPVQLFEADHPSPAIGQRLYILPAAGTMKEGMHFEYHLARLVKMRGYFIAFGIMRKGTKTSFMEKQVFITDLPGLQEKSVLRYFLFGKLARYLFRDALHWQAALLQKTYKRFPVHFDPMFLTRQL